MVLSAVRAARPATKGGGRAAAAETAQEGRRRQGHGHKKDEAPEAAPRPQVQGQEHRDAGRLLPARGALHARELRVPAGGPVLLEVLRVLRAQGAAAAAGRRRAVVRRAARGEARLRRRDGGVVAS